MDSTDLTTLSDGDVKALMEQLKAEEKDLSYRRRLLHGRIDLLRAEMTRRRKADPGSAVSDLDVDELSRILAGRLSDMERLEGAGE